MSMAIEEILPESTLVDPMPAPEKMQRRWCMGFLVAVANLETSRYLRGSEAPGLRQ
jgi:hypothetical protein